MDVDYIPLTGDFGFYELAADFARADGIAWDVATWHFCMRCSRSCAVCAPGVLVLLYGLNLVVL